MSETPTDLDEKIEKAVSLLAGEVIKRRNSEANIANVTGKLLGELFGTGSIDTTSTKEPEIDWFQNRLAELTPTLGAIRASLTSMVNEEVVEGTHVPTSSLSVATLKGILKSAWNARVEAEMPSGVVMNARSYTEIFGASKERWDPYVRQALRKFTYHMERNWASTAGSVKDDEPGQAR